MCLFRAVFSDPVDYQCGACYCNKVFASRRERLEHRKERHPAVTFAQGRQRSEQADLPPPPTSSSSDDSSDADGTDPQPSLSQKKNKRKRNNSLAQKKKGASNWQAQKLDPYQEYVRRLTSIMIFNNKMLSVLPMEALGDPGATVSSRSLMVSNYWKYRMRGLSCSMAEQAVVQETCFYQLDVRTLRRQVAAFSTWYDRRDSVGDGFFVNKPPPRRGQRAPHPGRRRAG